MFLLDGAKTCSKRVSSASMVLERKLAVKGFCTGTERRIGISFDDKLLLCVVMCVGQGGCR